MRYKLAILRKKVSLQIQKSFLLLFSSGNKLPRDCVCLEDLYQTAWFIWIILQCLCKPHINILVALTFLCMDINLGFFKNVFNCVSKMNRDFIGLGKKWRNLKVNYPFKWKSMKASESFQDSPQTTGPWPSWAARWRYTGRGFLQTRPCKPPPCPPSSDPLAPKLPKKTRHVRTKAALSTH